MHVLFIFFSELQINPKGKRQMKGKYKLQQMSLKATGFMKRQSPTILICVGTVGVVATSVAASKATLKAKALLDKAEKEKGEKLTKKEVLKAVAPTYIPAVVLGTATISCVVGAHIIDKRRHAALVSAYTVLDRSYKEYKDKTEELYGEEAHTKIKEAIAKDKYEKNPEIKKEFEDKHNNDVLLWFDEYSNRYFWQTMEEVKYAEYHLNRNFALRGYADLNEFYAFLGLGPTAHGAEIGWSIGVGEEHYGYTWIDFYHKLHQSDDPNTPDYYTIEMPFAPTADYMDY